MVVIRAEGRCDREMRVNGPRYNWGLFTFKAKEMTMKESCSREELIERAYQLGFDYEKKYRGCSQCTLAAIYDTLDFNDDNVFKAATGFGYHDI